MKLLAIVLTGGLLTGGGVLTYAHVNDRESTDPTPCIDYGVDGWKDTKPGEIHPILGPASIDLAGCISYPADYGSIDGQPVP